MDKELLTRNIIAGYNGKDAQIFVDNLCQRNTNHYLMSIFSGDKSIFNILHFPGSTVIVEEEYTPPPYKQLKSILIYLSADNKAAELKTKKTLTELTGFEFNYH
ncbi:MAG: hypothetical protein AABX16_03645 [Nanoarchaeota archaeon]